MNNLSSLLPQIVNIINEYGVLVNIYRDIYVNNEIGIKQLHSKGNIVCAIKVVIDNSSTSTANNRFKVEGVIRPQQYGTIYYAYDKNVNLEREDYFIIDGIKYILDVPQNILHYNLLYQANVEATVE